ncbi:MAG: hypothetical protein ABJQ71_15210 [Roseibium sp.]
MKTLRGTLICNPVDQTNFPNENIETILYVYESDKPGSFNEVGISSNCIKKIPITWDEHPSLVTTSTLFNVLTKLLEEQYQFKVEYVTSGPNDNFTADILIVPPASIQIRGPSVPADFFDTLRNLDNTLIELAEYLRGINDPSVLDARLKLVRASTESMRCYIDIENEHGPEEIPGEVASGLRDRLRDVDWKTLSDQANKWAGTIIKIIEGLLKGSS